MRVLFVVVFFNGRAKRNNAQHVFRCCSDKTVIQYREYFFISILQQLNELTTMGVLATECFKLICILCIA